MIRFECDYAEGAHQKILENMMRTNLEQTAGYSEDVYSDHARELIRQACGKEDLDVHFLVGGTQTNLTVLASYCVHIRASALRCFQSCECP